MNKLNYIKFIIILFVSSFQVSDLRAIEREIDWRDYQPTRSYKPKDVSALDWVKGLELEFVKRQNNVHKPSPNFLKQIRQEISSTIAGKYGVSKVSATQKETQIILNSVFKTARYFSNISFMRYYLDYDLEQKKKNLETNDKFEKHLAFICAAHYISQSDHAYESNRNERFYSEAILLFNNQEIKFLQPIISYSGSFRYSFSSTSEKFSVFIKDVYLQSSDDPHRQKLLNMLSAPEWAWLLKITENICPKGPYFNAKYPFKISTGRTFFKDLLSKNETQKFKEVLNNMIRELTPVVEREGKEEEIDINPLQFLNNYLTKILKIEVLLPLPFFQLPQARAEEEKIRNLLDCYCLLEQFEKGFEVNYDELISKLEKAKKLLPFEIFQKASVSDYYILLR